MGSGVRGAVSCLLLSAVMVAAACGSSTPAEPKGNVVMASTNFTENTILAYIYGGALQAKGWQVQYKINLGNREIVEPALERGDIDAFPDYAATELEFLNKGAGEATSDINETLANLRQRTEPRGLKALDASSAVDQSAFVVTRSTAQKYNLKKLSDLAPVGNQLTLGAGPACPRRPLCQPGLERVYGIHFKAYRSLDVIGPLTKAALERGDIDVAVLTTTDASIAEKGWIALEDDKHLQPADNILPLVRAKVLTGDMERLLNSVSAALTTETLVQMNKAVIVDKQDPEAAANKWLTDHKFKR